MTKRKIEIFSAGCSVCQDTIDLVNSIACSSCEIEILDMQDSQVAKKAKDLGIKSVPAIVVDNVLADCCTGNGLNELSLRALGIGTQA